MKNTLLLICLLLAFFMPAVLFTQTGGDYSSELTALKVKVAGIVDTKSTDPDRQAKLVDIYTQSIAYLEAAKNDRQQAHEFSQALTNSPASLARIQLELNAPDPKAEKLPEDLEAVEQDLLNKQTELLFNSQLSENRTAIASEQELGLSVMLAQAQQQLTASQNKLSLPLTEKSVDLGEAQRV